MLYRLYHQSGIYKHAYLHEALKLIDADGWHDHTFYRNNEENENALRSILLQQDAERKKSLVGVLSQLSNISNSESPMQFLIITHDAEIFEDSTVEKIYKFESSEEGSKVIAI